MNIKLYAKPISIGLLIMFVLSIPMGYFVSQVQEYLLGVNGLSYKYSDLSQITEVLSKYDFHPYVLGAHLFSSLVTISMPSFIVAIMAKDNKVYNGLIMGVVSVILLIYWSNLDIIYNIKFIIFVVLLDMVAALLGAFLGKAVSLRRAQ